MKGKLAIGTVVALAIAVIVVAIAIYFLVFVKLFDPYFLDPSKYKLVRYATCSLVLCANGKGEGQVDKVGCLEYEGGRCVKTCHDIQNELIVRAKDVGEEPKRFCGEKYAIDFEFDSSFPINLRSGEIQTLAKPKWVCRGTSILGSRLSFSEDIESSFRECIMFGNIRSVKGGVTPFWVTEDFEKGDGAEGCFSDSDKYLFRKVTFTPLIPFEELGKMKIGLDASFPAALYLTDKFTKEEDCQISETGPVLAELPDFTKVVANINTIPQCKIKTTDAKGRNKFKVWSDGLRELFLASPVAPTPNSDHCAYTVLDKEQAVYPFTEGKTLSSSREQIFPALVASNGKLYLFFQDADSVNQQAGVFTASGRDSTIVYATSSDGSFASFQGTPIPNLFPYEAVAKVLQPSATVLNSHKYLAYSTNLGKGETYDIMVKDLDGGANLKGGQPERATDDQVSQFNPSITAFDGKLYLFYEQDLPNLPSEIYYKVGTVTGDRVKWSEASLFASGWKNPSAAPTSDGLMITYSFDCGANSPLNNKPSFGGKPRFGQAGKSTESTKGAAACENGVGAAIFKDDNFQDAGIVESGSETYGISRPIAIGSDIFVFFDKGGESKRIFYSKYLGEVKWQESSPAVPYSSRSQVMPSLAEFGGGVTLAFSELGDNYDIRVSSLKGDLAGSSTPVASPPQQSSGQETAKSLTISTVEDSYKQGETVNVKGALSFGSSSSEGQEVKLRLRLKLEVLGSVEVEDFPKTATVGKDGSFTVDYKLAQNAATGEYTIAAEYGQNIVTHKFTVKEGPIGGPTSKADLSVADFRWDDASKELRYKVKNTGEVDVDGAQVGIRITASPEFGNENPYQTYLFPPGLPGDLSTMVPGFQISYGANLDDFEFIGGKTKFTLAVDYLDALKEFDESNNVREVTVDLPESVASCVSLESNGPPEKKVDVVFIPDRYASGKSKFLSDVKSAVSSFKTIEPFKSNQAKFNFYYIDSSGLDLAAEDRAGRSIDADIKRAVLYSYNCKGHDEIIVMTDKGLVSAALIGQHFAQVRTAGSAASRVQFAAWHEFGHSFGNLQDEYLSLPESLGGEAVASYILKSANCDVEGCPKWCGGSFSSEYRQVSGVCSAAKTADECVAAGSTFTVCAWAPVIDEKIKQEKVPDEIVGVQDQPASCSDLAFKDRNEIARMVISNRWYASNCFTCIPVRSADYGDSCQKGTGCFLGCGRYGGNLWRPSHNSIMNDDRQEGGQEFNEPSKKQLLSLLENYS